MTTTANQVTDAVTGARAHWLPVMAATLRAVRDLGLAGEAVDAAYAAAATRWPVEGAPADPAAWLIEEAAAHAAMHTGPPAEPMPMTWPASNDPIEDETNVLFLACHGAISPYMRAALTLRLACGVPVTDIAAMFGVAVPAMVSSLRRAKATISASDLPFPPTSPEDVAHALRNVDGVAAGLIASAYRPPVSRDRLSVDMLAVATALAERLHHLFPDDTETTATLAQAVLVRGWSGNDPDGTPASMLADDRDRWDRAVIDRAHELVIEALTAGGRGPGVLRASILSLLSRAATWAEVDWNEVLQLHEVLVCVDPSPGAALSRLFALAQVEGAKNALAEFTQLERAGAIAPCRHLYSTQAYLLEGVGRVREAGARRRQASRFAASPFDWDILAQRVLPAP